MSGLWFKNLNQATLVVQIFMTVQERLKSERERLGFTQPDVATLTKVGKTTVINWEKGSSSPTAVQLEQLARVGVDVLFVVTGKHAGGVAPAPTLTAEESTMLEYFRQAPPAVRRAALGALIGAEPTQSKAKESPRYTVDFGGASIEQAAAGNIVNKGRRK